MPEKVTIAYRGAKYEIGRGKRYYGIWVAGAPESDPIDRWPENRDGWTQAWVRFTAMETPGTISAVGKPRAGLKLPARKKADSDGLNAFSAAAGRRLPSRATVAAGLIGFGVLLGLIGLFPGYVISSGVTGPQSLASSAEEFVPHLIYLVAWAASGATIALGARRAGGSGVETLRMGALFGCGVSAVTFGLFFFDLGQVISGGSLGAGLLLSLLGWLACAAGSVLALFARPRVAAAVAPWFAGASPADSPQPTAPYTFSPQGQPSPPSSPAAGVAPGDQALAQMSSPASPSSAVSPSSTTGPSSATGPSTVGESPAAQEPATAATPMSSPAEPSSAGRSSEPASSAGQESVPVPLADEEPASASSADQEPASASPADQEPVMATSTPGEPTAGPSRVGPVFAWPSPEAPTAQSFPGTSPAGPAYAADPWGRTRAGGPARPRAADAGPIALVLLAAIGAVAAFAPSWDRFTFTQAATGATQTITRGDAFAFPGVMIAGNVAAMVAVIAVAVLAALWRPVRHGGLLLAGATIPLAAQAISALIQVSQPANPALFGISPSDGVTITSGVTPIFWVYCVFVISLVVSCAWMLTAPRYHAMPRAPQPPTSWPVHVHPAQRVDDEDDDSDGDDAEDDAQSTYA